MSLVIPSDVAKRVSELVATGKYNSADEVWRSALEALAEADEDLEAIQQAVDDWRAGDQGVPLTEAIDIVRNSKS